MTWLTRISWFDTMEDLHDNLLLQVRKESIELLHGLMGEVEVDDSFDSHPLVRMWSGYETALAAYAAVVQIETVRRGYHSKGAMQIDTVMGRARREEPLPFETPPWKDDTDVLRSHRSNLIRRFPGEYRSAWRGTPERMPYLWPFPSEDGGYGLFVSKYDRDLLSKGERALSKDIKKRVENL